MPADFDSDNGRAYEPPLPLEDRLWRHPSELGLRADAGPRVVLRKRPSPARVLVAAAVGLVAGTVVGIGALVASGSLESNSPAPPVERLAAPTPRATPGGELAIAEQALPAVTRVEVTGPAGTRTATGVMVRDDGVLLTTSDVLDGADTITVTLDDGSSYPASLVGRDRRNDIGVLDIEATGLPVAALPDARLDQAVGFGDQVVIVDASAADDPSPRVSQGFVAGPSTALPAGTLVATTEPSSMPMYGMVHVQVPDDTAVAAGGSILLDANGSLIGVVTARTVPDTTGGSPADDTSRFATPFDHARRVYEELVDTGSYTAGRLLADVEALEPEAAASLDLPNGGLVLRSEPSGPLAETGLSTGDVITSVNDVPISDVNDKFTELRRYSPGDEVELDVVRDGTPTTVVVRLSSDDALP